MEEIVITRDEARAIAKAICKDIKTYVQTHQDEFEEFREAQRLLKGKGASIDEQKKEI